MSRRDSSTRPMDEYAPVRELTTTTESSTGIAHRRVDDALDDRPGVLEVWSVALAGTEKIRNGREPEMSLPAGVPVLAIRRSRRRTGRAAIAAATRPRGRSPSTTP